MLYNSRLKIVDLARYAAKTLAPHGAMVVIEPLSIRPNYYLRSYADAKSIATATGTFSGVVEPNLKVMLDSYHLQRLHGNLTENIEVITIWNFMAKQQVISDYFLLQNVKAQVGHVQISQTPDRDNPMNCGEVNHEYFLKLVSQFYDDYIGLEYSS